MMKKYLLLLTGAALLLVFFVPPRSSQAQSQPPTAVQITDYLNAHPRLTETGAHVLGVEIQGEALIIDLSPEVLPTSTYNEAIFNDLQSGLDAAFGINQIFLTTFKVAGELLDYWGRPIPDFSFQAEPPAGREARADGPLSGVTVALSPGHGLYWNESYEEWTYQRAAFNGIREDTLNSQIMLYLEMVLAYQGATVIPLREFEHSRVGENSLSPAWHEAARQYAMYLRLPEWIWNGSNNNYNSDIRTRPYMANYYGADILISFHNNGWDGTLTGTETYWDTDNHPNSLSLATAVHNNIISRIRAEYDSSWTSRGVKASDSGYGEINYAQMPAALVELAFMDNLARDNVYLHDEAFKQLAAVAIAEGICDFQGVTCPNLEMGFPQLDHQSFVPIVIR